MPGGRPVLQRALQRGAERGEVRPEAVSRLVAMVGPAMISSYWLNESTEVPDGHLRSVVDEILMPIVRP